MTSFTGNK